MKVQEKNKILLAIQQIGKQGKPFTSTDVARHVRAPVSRQYVISILRGEVAARRLIRQGTTVDSVYILPKFAGELSGLKKKRLINRSLKEHEVLDDLNRDTSLQATVKENIYSIFSYAFSEMLNNAIEHSRSAAIEIEVGHRQKKVSFVVRDFGVGVFRNVMKKRKLRSELEAIQDLLKGKLTTQPKAHSGEGIFFTSRVADVFVLESYGLRLRIDNLIHDVFVEELHPKKRGTKVTFVIRDNSVRHLNSVFKKYQTKPSEYAFDKTEVRVKLYTMGTVYISRSQARRVLAGLEKFKLVILDFKDVPTIGQAFADEIFRVYKAKYPKIRIQPIHMNEAVRFMIGRVAKE